MSDGKAEKHEELKVLVFPWDDANCTPEDTNVVLGLSGVYGTYFSINCEEIRLSVIALPKHSVILTSSGPWDRRSRCCRSSSLALVLGRWHTVPWRGLLFSCAGGLLPDPTGAGSPPRAALTSQQRGVNVPEATLRGEATLGGIILNFLSLQLQDTHDEDLFSLLSFICSTFSLPQQCFLASFAK